MNDLSQYGHCSLALLWFVEFEIVLLLFVALLLQYFNIINRRIKQIKKSLIAHIKIVLGQGSDYKNKTKVFLNKELGSNTNKVTIFHIKA